MKLAGRKPVLLVSAVIVVLVAGGAFVALRALAPNPNEVCEGVTREMGGCDPGQPSFSGTNCPEVGREYGVEVDRRALAIFGGAEVVGGQAKSSRMASMTALVTARANQYLRNSGLVRECGVDEFLAAADTQFSTVFKSRVGDYMYEGTRGYEDWLADLRRFVRVIDMDEDEPFLPSP